MLNSCSKNKTIEVLFVILFLIVHYSSAQLSKAGEPCVTDKDCLEGWEYCAERQ